MAKINNTTRYPSIESSEITDNTILLGSESPNGGKTINVSFFELAAKLATLKSIKVTLNAATSYQNDEFIGKDYVFGFLTGQEILTGGLIQNFDNVTGTVVFNSSFGAITGEVIFVIQA